jgi:hypothetical protein
VSDLRPTISWLLVAMVGVIGAGAAVLGITQAPSNVSLNKAVANTLAASSYNEVVTQTGPTGTATDYLTFHAKPATLGGYIEESGRRTYVYVIGNTEYQSVPVASGTPPHGLTFYKQKGPGAAAVDPARHYLGFAKTGKNVTQSAGTYSFSLSQQGQTGHFAYTVSGQYVSGVLLTVATASASESVHVVIAQVGSARPVTLPKNIKIVKAPTTPTPG